MGDYIFTGMLSDSTVLDAFSIVFKCISLFGTGFIETQVLLQRSMATMTAKVHGK